MKHARFAVAVSLLLLGLSGASWAQDQSLPYYNAGNSFYAQKNYDQAIRYYQAAAQMNPQLWQAYQGEGNCYYAKGDKASALTNYQKALSINPSNPQLSSFTQTLQAQVGSNPQMPTNSGPVAQRTSPSAISNAPKFELDVLAGGSFVVSAPSLSAGSSGVSTGVSGGYGIGLGGGIGGYYPIGPNFAIGGNVAYYTYSANYSSNYSFGSISEGTTETVNQSNIEILAAAKYHFEGKDMRPYLLGGLGVADVSNSGSVTTVVSGSSGLNSGSTFPSTSSISPMIQIGGGVEVPAGKDMNFFAEAKLGFIFAGGTSQSVTEYGIPVTQTSPGYTFIELPVNVGLDFNL